MFSKKELTWMGIMVLIIFALAMFAPQEYRIIAEPDSEVGSDIGSDIGSDNMSSEDDE